MTSSLSYFTTCEQQSMKLMISYNNVFNIDDDITTKYNYLKGQENLAKILWMIQSF